MQKHINIYATTLAIMCSLLSTISFCALDDLPLISTPHSNYGSCEHIATPQKDTLNEKYVTQYAQYMHELWNNELLDIASVVEVQFSIRAILQKGAYVDARDQHNRTPLIKAAGFNQLKNINCLLQAGANIHATDSDGENALTAAAYSNKTQTIALLLAHKAYVDTQGKNNCTALMSATWHNNEEAVKLLLNAQANPYLANNNNCTALSYAKSNSVRILLVTALQTFSYNPQKNT